MKNIRFNIELFTLEVDLKLRFYFFAIGRFSGRALLTLQVFEGKLTFQALWLSKKYWRLP